MLPATLGIEDRYRIDTDSDIDIDDIDIDLESVSLDPCVGSCL